MQRWQCPGDLQRDQNCGIFRHEISDNFSIASHKQETFAEQLQMIIKQFKETITLISNPIMIRQSF